MATTILAVVVVLLPARNLAGDLEEAVQASLGCQETRPNAASSSGHGLSSFASTAMESLSRLLISPHGGLVALASCHFVARGSSEDYKGGFEVYSVAQVCSFHLDDWLNIGLKACSEMLAPSFDANS